MAVVAGVACRVFLNPDNWDPLSSQGVPFLFCRRCIAVVSLVYRRCVFLVFFLLFLQSDVVAGAEF
jgi:hypothetical protein